MRSECHCGASLKGPEAVHGARGEHPAHLASPFLSAAPGGLRWKEQRFLNRLNKAFGYFCVFKGPYAPFLPDLSRANTDLRHTLLKCARRVADE